MPTPPPRGWSTTKTRQRCTGVIVGISAKVDQEQCRHVIDALTDRFPGVKFAVVPGADSVAFECDEMTGDDR